MTKSKIARFLLRRKFRVAVITSPAEINRIWSVMKTVCHSRYTKSAFLENIKKTGFYAYTENEKGYMTSIWMARAARLDDVDGVFVELTWHNKTIEGRNALAFLAFNFLLSLRENTKIWYYAKKNPWKNGKVRPDGFFEFDTHKLMEDLWAAETL